MDFDASSVKSRHSREALHSWFPTTGILMPAFASVIAIAALWLKVGTRHGGHGGLGAFLIYAFGIVLVAGYVVQLVSFLLALLAVYRHAALRSGFPAALVGLSGLHVALGSFYFFQAPMPWLGSTSSLSVHSRQSE